MLSAVEDTVEKEDGDNDKRLVLAVEGVVDAGVGDSAGALAVMEEGLSRRVVGLIFGVEESVDGAADGSLVLRVLLGAEDVVSGISGLLVGLASMETGVVEVLVADAVRVVFSVVTGSTMCGTVVIFWVEAAGRKHKLVEG